MKPTTETSIEAQGVATPDIDLFKATLQEISTDASTVVQRRRIAENTRYCLWEGQSADGRKHKAANGNKDVFPFEGGSDHRVRLADTIINENVRLGMAVLRGADVEIDPTEISDAEYAGRCKTVFRWLRRSGKREIEAAVRLYLNYREGDGPGVGVMGVFWERKFATEPQELTLPDLVQMFFIESGIAEPDPEQVQRATDLFLNPNLEDDALTLLTEFFQLRRPEARSALGKLRTGESATIQTPYMAKNGLCLRPLRLWEDVFFPPNTTDIQDAPCIFAKELVTESQLQTMAQANNWPKQVVDQIKEHKGKAYLNFDQWADSRYRGSVSDVSVQTMTDQNKNKFEIITAYTKAFDPKSRHGLSSVYRTVFHGSVDEVLEHKPNGYWHGKYPFVVGTQERVSKNLLDSRGVPELVLTDQLVTKSQVDLTIDASQLSAIPSIKMRTKRKDLKLNIGPLSKHYLDRGEDWEYADGPKPDHRSQTILDRVEKAVDMYFGRKTPNVDPAYGVEVRQDRAGCIAGELEEIFSMGLDLAQQYLTQEEAERIAPGWKQPFNGGGAQAVRKRYDLHMSFDVKSQDPEFVEGKLKAFNNYLVPLDKYGILDGATILSDAAKLIDPNMADRYVKSPQSASQAEVEETMQALGMILDGIQPAMPERGINHKLRFETLWQAVNTNPQIQAELKSKPISLQLYTDYMSFLQQQLVQEKNKTTGRKGVSPTFGGTANQATVGFIQ